MSPADTLVPDRLARDIAGAVSRLSAEWPRLAGAKLLMTGGTGFIGRWLLEMLRAADLEQGLGLEVMVLSRDPDAFVRKAPHLADHSGFRLVPGDVRGFEAGQGDFTHVIHAAADASAALNEADPLAMFDTAVEGTRQVLQLARKCRVTRVLMLSSGAVYGAQPWDMTHVAEDWTGGPDLSSHRSAYAEGKRAAEMLGTIYRQQHGMDVGIARIFTVLGPLLPLDTHFAAGNFLRDAMAGKAVTVNGDGRAVRSYLYAADLAEWLWAMLLRAPVNATYNLGSEQGVSLGELAERTARLIGNGRHEILGQADAGWNPGRYVPSTAKIRRELGVSETVDLDKALRRTAAWNGWNA